MSQNVSRCPKMSKNVEKCPGRLCTMVWADSEMRQNSKRLMSRIVLSLSVALHNTSGGCKMTNIWSWRLWTACSRHKMTINHHFQVFFLKNDNFFELLWETHNSEYIHIFCWKQYFIDIINGKDWSVCWKIQIYLSCYLSTSIFLILRYMCLDIFLHAFARHLTKWNG